MDKLLDDIIDGCEGCILRKRSPDRPAVAMPMANDFNDVVSMDLKINHKHNTIILYIVDLFSRYTAAHVIPDKKPESVIKPFLQSWILTRFGPPTTKSHYHRQRG